MVERFDPVMRSESGTWNEYATVESCGAGDFVAYDDYVELEEKLKEANDRIEELESAIDSIETSSGLTDNGNMWRFWSKKSTELAKSLSAAVKTIEQKECS
jgi:hypothetical protein